MKITGWKYYNHSAIPDLPPHVQVDVNPIQNGSIWNLTSTKGEKPLLARFHTEFDTKAETGFWFIIRDKPLSLDEFSKKRKKVIIKSLERCFVKKIDPKTYVDELYKVYYAAFRSYVTPDNEKSEKEFKHDLAESNLEYWAAFSKDTGEMAGWMSCANHGDWTETVSSKYHPAFQTSVRPSEGIHYYVLTHYLNELGQKYICSGSRNINHKTHVQDYKIRNWNFRPAYCNLHIVYNPKISWLMKFLYHLRKFLLLFDREKHFHQLNSLLKMDEISKENIPNSSK